MAEPYNVLFLCTGNSARSIMAEAIMNHWGEDRSRAYSAGSHPKGYVHPMAIEMLESNRLSTKSLDSKSWDEFSRPESPQLHFVFTLCNQAAGEVCPVWPGQPMTAHWGIDDPAAVEGPVDVVLRAFNRTYYELDARIKIFTSLRLERLDRMALRRELQVIDTVAPRGREIELFPRT